jgi:hypothetical protein
MIVYRYPNTRQELKSNTNKSKTLCMFVVIMIVFRYSCIERIEYIDAQLLDKN